MVRLVLSQLRRRGSRTVALVVAILVAATGFTVLTAYSDTNRVKTVGDVQAHSRTAYDILVRPKGSRSSLETSKGLVQPGLLTGQYGGISLAQWHKIEALHDIDVAAPVATVGYMTFPLTLPVDMSAAFPKSGDAVGRMDVTWSYDNGLSTVRQQPDFAYLTSDRLTLCDHCNALNQGEWRVSSGGTICTIAPLQESDIPLSEVQPTLLCFSRTSAGDDTTYAHMPRGVPSQQLEFPIPMMLAAVDPVQETKLDGLDGAVTSGQSLEGAPVTDPDAPGGQAVPILAANAPTTGLDAHITLSQVGGSAVRLVQDRKPGPALSGQPYTPVKQETITAAQAYTTLLSRLREKVDPRQPYIGNLYWYTQASEPRTDPTGTSVVTAKPPQFNRIGGYSSLGTPARIPGANDTPLRDVTEVNRFGDDPAQATPTTLIPRGTFDPSKLKGLAAVTAQILAGYAVAPTTGADAKSTALLGNRALAPSASTSGFVQPPPLLLTSLDALPQLDGPGWDPQGDSAPISAIRVRVAGVTGVDALSRARVRVAAQEITDATGLDVDITVGSSAGGQTLTVPAGKFGRPTLHVSQSWVKKGVAVAILKALDTKSIALFVLVLLVCALSVANSAIASVRARRGELGVLACLGWRRRQLFSVVFGELALVALAAGVIAVGTSFAFAEAIGTTVTWQRALLAVPAALLVALVAGAVPAALAARAQPMDAVNPVVRPPRRARAPRGVLGLGLANVARTRARTLVAAAGLFVAVCAFTLLLGITVAFRGTIVGTLLGDAVAVQVRGADYAAAAATLVLAGIGVANVLYLNLRDRGPEIATLRALGWHEGHLSRLVITEGAAIAIIGAVPGAALGLLGASLLAGGISASLIVAALIALGVGQAVAVAASAIPVWLLSRMPTAVLLTEE